ncbi:excitatory amino acid transporter 3-like [Bradysia coprophila]|uniref:excitatory amino acid transporter 3-like n=1 Tax=Bradysia coprophila TaxID=38358 RepID=UPI00187D99B4|nr:excitatory amino acid transporter 3-like [Bradysia coprophila]
MTLSNIVLCSMTRMDTAKLKKFLKEQRLTFATFLSVILGVVCGCIIRATSSTQWHQRDIMYLNFIGEIFMRMLKCLILPLMASSIMTAIGSLDLSLSKKIGVRAVAFYITTTFLSVVLGIILTVTIQPGADRSDASNRTTDEEDMAHHKPHVSTTVDTLLDLIRNLFPPNIVQACTRQFQTNLTQQQGNPSDDIFTWHISSDSYIDGLNIMGVVAMSCVFGVATSVIRDSVQNLSAIISQFDKVIMKVTQWVILLSPVGIFFLTMSQIVKMENLADIAGKLGLYFLTVTAGLSIQGLVVLPIIYFALTRANPYKFFGGLSQALMTAFGTSSSSATLPVTIQCLVEKNGVDSNLAKFMVPIGAVINMDGTALYEAVAALFMAQYYGVELTFGKIVAVSITATAASIGAAGIPSAGLVTLIMVLEAVGAPTDKIGLIMSVDWLLDRIRTVVNVMGDSVGAGVVMHLCRNDLEKLDENSAAIEEKFQNTHC